MLNKVMLMLMTAFFFTLAGLETGIAGSAVVSEDGAINVLIPLSEDEEADLLFMREEEKLARDVYLLMALKWNLNTFTKIATSEQRHMDAVKNLLNTYNLTDPVDDESIPDNFKEESLNVLYDDFLLRGDMSLGAALLVGAEIEEIDILDLQAVQERANPEHTDIIGTYESLECASRNHLRAFVRHIELQGEPYVPVFIDDTEYDAIIESPMERNCGNSKGHGHRKGPKRDRVQMN